VLDPCTIRLATLRGSQCILRSQGFSLNSAIHGIHGSFQKSIASPLLTTKQAPFRITHFNFSIAFHRGEAYLRGSLPNQSSYTLYLLLRASRHKLFFLRSNHPSEFGEQSLVKHIVLSKSKTTRYFWETKHIPKLPCKVRTIQFFRIPPKPVSC
jgi:hypothetical protein